MNSIKKFFKKFTGRKESVSSDTSLPFRDWGVVLLVSFFLFLALIGGGVWLFYTVNTPPQMSLGISLPAQKKTTKEEILTRLQYLEAKKEMFQKLKAGVLKTSDPSL